MNDNIKKPDIYGWVQVETIRHNADGLNTNTTNAPIKWQPGIGGDRSDLKVRSIQVVGTWQVSDKPPTHQTTYFVHWEMKNGQPI